jgi:hypothetical protein
MGVRGGERGGPVCTPGRRNDPCETHKKAGVGVAGADGVAANAGARQPDFHFAGCRTEAAGISQANATSETAPPDEDA